MSKRYKEAILRRITNVNKQMMKCQEKISNLMNSKMNAYKQPKYSWPCCHGENWK